MCSETLCTTYWHECGSPPVQSSSPNEIQGRAVAIIISDPTRSACSRHIQKVCLVYGHYVTDEYLLKVTNVQERVSLDGSRLAPARDYESNKSDSLISWPSVQLSDG